QVPRHRAFGDPVGGDPAGDGVGADGPHRIGDLGTTPVVDAHGQRAGGVTGGEPFGLLQFVDHRAPQFRPAAGPPHAHAPVVHLVPAAPQHVPVEAHQELHFGR